MVDPYNEPERVLHQHRKMNQGRGDLGLGRLGNCGNDHQENPKDVNNPRVSKNPENVDNQGIPPHVPVILTRSMRDVAVSVNANLASIIRKLPPA